MIPQNIMIFNDGYQGIIYYHIFLKRYCVLSWYHILLDCGVTNHTNQETEERWTDEPRGTKPRATRRTLQKSCA